MSSPTVRGALCVAMCLSLATMVVPGLSEAFVTNTGVVEQNGVHGGVLDLKLNETGPTNGHGSTTDESDVDTVHDTWEDRNHDTLGGDTVSNTLETDNAVSTIDASRVNISISFAENDSTTDDGDPANTSRTIDVTTFAFGGSDLIGGELTDQNGNDRVDVEDLTLGSNADNLSDRSGLAAGASTNLTVEMSGSADLLEGTGSGDGIDMTVTVRLHTHSFTEADRSVNNTIQYG